MSKKKNKLIGIAVIGAAAAGAYAFLRKKTELQPAERVKAVVKEGKAVIQGFFGEKKVSKLKKGDVLSSPSSIKRLDDSSFAQGTGGGFSSVTGQSVILSPGGKVLEVLTPAQVSETSSKFSPVGKKKGLEILPISMETGIVNKGTVSLKVKEPVKGELSIKQMLSKLRKKGIKIKEKDIEKSGKTSSQFTKDIFEKTFGW